MQLKIIHRTAYTYAAPVSQSFNEARLKPMTADGQVCNSFLLKVNPATQLSHYLDFYSNYVQIFEIQEPHHSLTIESAAEVVTHPQPISLDEKSVPLALLPDCAQLVRCYDFIQASPLIPLSPEIWRLAVDATQRQTDVWQSAVAIMRFVHAEFSYAPLSTQVNTPMTKVLEQRRGVCQDFAHVMIGMCRSIKMPARYVSGYLYNGPSDQLTGSQASHAWCEVYVPDLGWRSLDPTNNQPTDERYVKLAIGRDYQDVAPIKGHYRGTSDLTMDVQLSVRLRD